MPANKKSQAFWKEFLHDHNVAAVSPSSPFLIKRLLRRLNLVHAHTVVEFGPGTGVATAAVLAGLPADATYLACETNPAFAAALTAWPDPRLTVVNDDSRRIKTVLAQHGLKNVDLVISSIPFGYLSENDRADLVADVKSLLRPGGKFVVFHQYSALMEPHLKRNFAKVHVEFEPLNVFPCFLIEGVKE
ncbi:MAG: rRNA adenine N-6-methyltransferase family protein [Patescibacteria group bacterium]|nr:rRNA adenine N-6-methyltransferase family protein [Patescibacteria group bacterium]